MADGVHVGYACPACHGRRLRPESLAVRVNGMSIAEFTAMPMARALEAACATRNSASAKRRLPARIVEEIRERLEFLNAVGLGYISAWTARRRRFRGGEAQRIRLATQIGSKLRGVLYVLDEPSIGLHPRDNDRLLDALESLRDLGNTVLVVEHDAETIRRADYVIDLGPGAGRQGGEAGGQRHAGARSKRTPLADRAVHFRGRSRSPIATTRRQRQRQQRSRSWARARTI